MNERGHILITRPEAEAEGLADAVRDMGFIPVIEPMMAIIPVDAAVPSLDAYAALVFTSANGARVFSTLTPERGHPVYCTGDATAAAARACGWKDVHSAAGDAEDLMALIAAAGLPEGSGILHLAGAHVSRDIVVAGIRVERLVVYEAEAAEGFSPVLLDMLDRGGLTAAVFFSARTAKIFAELLQRAGRTDAVKSTKALCIGDSVVKSLRHLNWQDVQVSGRPDLGGMLALIKALP